MTLRKAKDIFREFHSKEPSRVIPLETSIPKFVYPIGYSVQISYRSDKWNNEKKFLDYIHWWENPTLVCVTEKMLDDIILPRNRSFSSNSINVGPKRREVTYLGYAIDFSLSQEDRSKIPLGPGLDFADTFDSNDLNDAIKLKGSIIFEFDATPGESRNYVVSSPSGRIIYIIDDENRELFAFINARCQVTNHGITG